MPLLAAVARLVALQAVATDAAATLLPVHRQPQLDGNVNKAVRCCTAGGIVGAGGGRMPRRHPQRQRPAKLLCNHARH